MADVQSIMFERYGDWVLLVHGDSPPANDEWNQYVQLLLEADASGAKGLMVLSEGPGPNSTQRKMVSEAKIRTAVITLSRVGRGIVTALGWLGVNIKPFAPDQFPEVFKYLGVEDAYHQVIMRRLVEMRFTLANRDPSAVASMSASQLADELNKAIKDVGDS